MTKMLNNYHFHNTPLIHPLLSFAVVALRSHFRERISFLVRLAVDMSDILAAELFEQVDHDQLDHALLRPRLRPGPHRRQGCEGLPCCGVAHEDGSSHVGANALQLLCQGEHPLWKDEGIK